MTDTSPTIEALTALIAERRKYEAWLKALDARRGTTPAHVLERVRADYTARLAAATSQMASHRDSLAIDVKSLRVRATELRAELTRQVDARAEMELRVLVGELPEEDAAEQLRAGDEMLARLGREREVLESRLAVAAESLAAIGGSAGRGFDEMSFLNAVLETSHAAGESSSPAPDAGETGRPRQRSAAGMAGGTSKAGRRGGSKREPSKVSSAGEPVEAPPAEAPPAEAPPAGGAMGMTEEAPGFFAVESEQAPPIDSGASTPEIIRHPDDLPSPMSRNPLRPSISPEGSKTLKCSECGSANYATEWYCERCGAALAVL